MTDKIKQNIWKERLKEELKDKVKFDTVTLQLFSTAACIYDITPLAVVIPADENDIIKTINICREFCVPVLPRGAGSSLSGNAVGEAVIMDLTHSFKNVELLENSLVRCGVGVVLNDLQDKLSSDGKKFAPDPSSGNVCVIGGMLGNNSGGPHTLKHGNMYKHVEEVNIVLSNGKVFNGKNIEINEINNLDDFHKPYYEKVKSLLENYNTEITENKPYVTKSASGYQVWDILTDTRLNMASLLVGSEGTLGVFTDAVLKVIPVVPKRGIMSLYFDDIAKMGIAVQHLRKLRASAIEFVDESFIRLALTFKPELEKFLPSSVKYLLYVEFEGENEDSINQLFDESRRIISDEEKLADIGSSSTDEKEIVDIIRVRKAATVILNKIEGKEKPVPFVEDAAVHPDVFPQFLVAVSELMKRYSFRFVMFGHAGDGNLHIRPLLSFKDGKTFQALDNFMEEFVDLVLTYKGTLTGEHGDGRLRTEFMERSFSKLIPLFKELKELFDPSGIMNPDIIVPSKSYKWNENFRYNPDYAYTETISGFDSTRWREEIEKCHGCGTCREYCPVFVATGEEEATARSKANILRGIISGKVELTAVDTNHFYKIMDYCLNCGQCLTDCPTSVNIPGIAILAKEKLHENRQFKTSEFILQRGKVVSSLASMFSFISNRILSISYVRKLMQFFVGIDSRRNFPLFARPKKISKPKESEGKKKIVLWTGCAAQYNDPDGELENSMSILKKLGYEVILPEWKCCNVAKISYGNIKSAMDDINYNMKVLLPYAEENIPIIFTSASCGYAFMHEYSTFLPERDDIKKVAEVSWDIHDFLGKLFSKREYAESFNEVKRKIVYHAPCHLKTQKNQYGPLDLVKHVPGIEIISINDSCCGIAGTFGMKKENFALSMEIGSKLFEEIENAAPDEVLSGCGTCQIQINQGTGLNVIHPISIINESFHPQETTQHE
ncbi:MAG: anaerobic glycerol-3-phosphate dehydrogenase subunit C [Bacteroidetes bacterium]|nr:anaerobic glycerol-3-phosphate dehydrogenase subunit C [Bacteroidota bacterium]